MTGDLATRVRETIETAWRPLDPDTQVSTRPRVGGMLDVTVVSSRFESLESEERERLLWETIRNLPPDDALRMTYSLLLTPSEAAIFSPLPEENNESGSLEDRKDLD
jgi:hypothetical protein